MALKYALTAEEHGNLESDDLRAFYVEAGGGGYRISAKSSPTFPS